MSDGGGLDAFCNSTFWDANITWNTENPDFTLCFEQTVLVWVPCGFLWLFAPLEVHYLRHSVDRLVPWSWVNVSKLVISLLILILQCISFFYTIQQHSTGNSVADVYYVTPCIIFASVLLQLIFVMLDKKYGIQSSGYLFIFWLLLMVFAIPEFYTNINNGENVNVIRFVVYSVYFPLTILMFLLNCFGDATPEYIDYPLGDKPSPETSASFLSRVTFAWMDPLIWKGYRKPLVQADTWDLARENASRNTVAKWDKNWKKTLKKAKKIRNSEAWATYSNNAVHVEVPKGEGKRQQKISILPTMVRTFGPTFFFGAVLKVMYDVLQFVSPQILGLLISFSESTEEDDPQWRGFLYAAVMLVCAQLQSFILGQYFMKMFLAGLQIRTGVISAVYRKALRISNSAKKNSTVGEIVNLMAVDAQRFMDLTTYINMLWSAPLQIALALYFLWQILGPSVLAGLAVMIVLIPVNGVIANQIKHLQIKQMKNKDQRVKLMNEILNGIKVLKLYAWEPSFEEQVLDVRSTEVNVLKKSAYLNASTAFIWTCTPFMVSLASFSTFISVSPENVLDAKTAFVSISLFNLMQFPITMLPMMITSMVQAKVSLKRLNNFLNADELDPNNVSRDNTENSCIKVENGTFAWGHDEEDSKPVLKDINLDVKESSLVAVVGTVGAGKSSLCSAILGEMEKQSGRVNIKGSIAYVSQQAWIQNSTLENNILFNYKKDDDRYNSCIRACALVSDLEMLPGGDQTEIGEKGINLSGGQKQRVSLARAVYADTDVYLLDDPLSAVDSHVGKHIFEQVIGPEGLLKGKTRILVTHGITYLPQVDKIVVLKNGVVTEEGSYTELLNKKGQFQEFLLEYISQKAEEDDLLEDLEDIKLQLESKIGREALQRQISRKREESESESCDPSKNNEIIKRGSVKRTKTQSESEKAKPAISQPPQPPKNESGQKLIETEKAQTGTVGVKVYGYYIRAIGIASSCLTVMFYVLSQSCTVGSNMWLTKWSNEELVNGTMDPSVTDMYLGVYGAFGVGQAAFILTGSMIISRATILASKLLHRQMLGNVLHSPMSFFDMTPIGRIVNRFAKDLDTVDVLLPSNLRAWMGCFISVLATFAVIIYATPAFALVMIPTMIIYYFVQVLYVSTSRQLKRIESVSRSPIYSHFQESIQGASTIRAYGKEHQFIQDSEAKVDFNLRSSNPSVMANRWLAIRLEFIGNIMTFSAAMFAVVGRGNISGGIVGLSVSYALSVTQTLNWLVRMTSDVETNVVAVERIKEYTEVPQEAAWDISSKKPHKDWPDQGVVDFNNYSTRYREGMDLVVKDISFHINGGEKIGIAGRTGAGKSSLTLGLFRVIEAAGGNITIDGVNISDIGLHDLRGRLTIIPQDPVLFSGTLRMNLDPFGVFDDAEVWSALEHCHLKEYVSELSSGLQYNITEGGDNLSVGQRQLVCLGRALLRKTRLLVLDEATAAVDLETDDLIQQTIRREFTDCTVLTIAHRLNTIMDSTRVLVLDRGEVKEFDTPSNLLKDKTSIFYGMAKDAGLV
ncbi:multidrug resistance-associated protein 1-like isoform X3 [Homarus americanus]|uniref:multidrug resistance-associated protein 1-like isoform X3 n=1 Tax=Homarus americanus TaxID=6706 RepID=UPI001C457D8D|nr:multidrug resistance-associated protein 1-like isoform X3 [Homarus americanus]